IDDDDADVMEALEIRALAEQGYPDPYTVSHSSKELHL
ncbi:MAG TPA: rRNA maturation factor, partial [Alcanivorax sp.]|nr:rRNA maturation factor [Alcanivorax sp.]